MQHSIPSWPNTRIGYYNPAAKIQSLIRNLDAELTQLCNQCSIPKPVANSFADSSKSLPAKAMGPNSNSLLNTNNDPSGGIHVRTLSNIYRAKVIDAYRNRRIFTVYGNYHTIRRALLRRGWLEKLAPGRYSKLQALTEDVLLQHAKKGNEYEAVAISKIINHFPAFFIWQPKGQRDINADVLPYRNRVRRGRALDFSTKVGLIGCAEQEQWYRQEGLAGMSYPRFYRLSGTYEERASFMEDFHQTQCRSLLKFIIENVDTPDEIIGEDGTIPLNTVSFALARVLKRINELEHSALDEFNMPTTENLNPHEWQTFLENSSQILQKKSKLKGSLKDLQDYTRLARIYLSKCNDKRPDYKWDGCRNLWILKPGYQCRGIGIIIKNSLDEILQWSSNNPSRRYIAQKYVERPLLIYKTKFDIRQYMLLSIGHSTVSIWLYKDCYLRFSSQEYSVDDLREAIHLTNNSVQKKYRNKQARDPRLPKNNMWSLEQFKIYLGYQNMPSDTWEKKVFNGFKENLIAVTLSSLEETDFTENSFELYGCDFMLDENYQPILIEINSTPDLSPSTEVTARICPLALRDVIKVIVDLPINSRASTGQFELVYEVDYKIKNEFDPQVGLAVNGQAMTLFKRQSSYFRPKLYKKFLKISKKTENVNSKIIAKKHKKPPEVPQSKTGSTSKVSIKGKKLNGLAKEALALRYTIPK